VPYFEVASGAEKACEVHLFRVALQNETVETIETNATENFCSLPSHSTLIAILPLADARIVKRCFSVLTVPGLSGSGTFSFLPGNLFLNSADDGFSHVLLNGQKILRTRPNGACVSCKNLPPGFLQSVCQAPEPLFRGFRRQLRNRSGLPHHREDRGPGIKIARVSS
jgi:hypothetical protein